MEFDSDNGRSDWSRNTHHPPDFSLYRADIKMGKPERPLSSYLSPLVFGTAVFNHQYNPSPSHLPIFPLVHRALASGLTSAFDTSPYYGPSEVLLGTALAHPTIRASFPRKSYTILTKIGRVSGNCFDYSPEWIRRSVRRSLKRLRTHYLDVVYCHDVEFVSEDEVITAIKELRRIRDEDGTIKYVGISGYPVNLLCHLAERIVRETGEPLDVVQSYSNYNLQNTRLLSCGRDRLKAAGVELVTNASLVNMGLLRRNGVPIGSMGDWHPAPQGLRQAVKNASDWLTTKGERLEVLALRYGLENWLREGAVVGVSPPSLETSGHLGINVIGVSNLDELEDVVRVWQEILDDHELHFRSQMDAPDSGMLSPADSDSEDSPMTVAPHIERRTQLDFLVNGVRAVLGTEWVDYAWPSPDPSFVREPHIMRDDEDSEWLDSQVGRNVTILDQDVQQGIQQQLEIKDAMKSIVRPITPSSSSAVSRMR